MRKTAAILILGLVTVLFVPSISAAIIPSSSKVQLVELG